MITAPNSLLKKLAPELASAAEALRTNGESANLAPLRTLQRWCDRALHAATENPERFLLWVLSSFIDDLFYNLAADLRYDPKIEALRQEYFGSLSNTLSTLARALEAGDASNAAVAREDLVGFYLVTVEQISKAGPIPEPRVATLP